MEKVNVLIGSWLLSEFLSSIEFIKCLFAPLCSNESVPFTHCTVSPTGLSKTNFFTLIVFGTWF